MFKELPGRKLYTTPEGHTLMCNLPHPTQEIEINGQKCEIDLEMIPTVLWLNSLPNTHTSFSCQGNIARPIYTRPYVIFYTNDPAPILQMFKNFYKQSLDLHDRINTEIEIYEDKLRYTAKWHDIIALTEFNQFLKANNTPQPPIIPNHFSIPA